MPSRGPRPVFWDLGEQLRSRWWGGRGLLPLTGEAMEAQGRKVTFPRSPSLLGPPRASQGVAHLWLWLWLDGSTRSPAPPAPYLAER